MQVEIGRQVVSVEESEEVLAYLGHPVEGEGDTVARQRQQNKLTLEIGEDTIRVAEAFYRDIKKNWSKESQRVLGHVLYSPPISVSTGIKPYTEDWALIELDRSKIDWTNFRGNVMHLGTS